MCSIAWVLIAAGMVVWFHAWILCMATLACSIFKSDTSLTLSSGSINHAQSRKHGQFSAYFTVHRPYFRMFPLDIFSTILESSFFVSRCTLCTCIMPTTDYADPNTQKCHLDPPLTPGSFIRLRSLRPVCTYS